MNETIGYVLIYHLDWFIHQADRSTDKLIYWGNNAYQRITPPLFCSLTVPVPSLEKRGGRH